MLIEGAAKSNQTNLDTSPKSRSRFRATQQGCAKVLRHITAQKKFWSKEEKTHIQCHLIFLDTVLALNFAA